MFLLTMNSTTMDAMLDALAAHGGDRLAVAGLGRVTRDDSAPATAGLMKFWPADDDGMYRIALNENAAFIAWRAFIIAEIAAGRGLLDKHLAGYHATLGIETEPAYDYACAAAKGHGVRPCPDADHDSWSAGTEWVIESGDMPDPRKRWSRSAWGCRVRAHERLAAAGLALPGQYKWSPVATCLFVQPQPHVPAPSLSPAEDAAVALLAA